MSKAKPIISFLRDIGAAYGGSLKTEQAKLLAWLKAARGNPVEDSYFAALVKLRLSVIELILEIVG